jgi:hypothetical protein
MKTLHEPGMQRRAFLVRGVCAGAAGYLPAPPADTPATRPWRGKPGDVGGAAVPAHTINLATCGGVPGAPPTRLIQAFGAAFAALAAHGGGILFVPAGTYDFGRIGEGSNLVLCRNVRNIAISAYGATFAVTTTANVVPNIFYFFNFQNVTIAGARFIDHGFMPWMNWRGAYCVGLQADQFSSGFRMVDCFAEKVVGLVASNNNAQGRRFLSDISVQGEVHSAYYGVGANFVRERVHVDLVCHNVRRAFIAYSLRHADIIVRSHNTSAWPGSNGLVALVATGGSAGNVDNVCVWVDVSGDCIHRSYAHFYHQGTAPSGYMRDIDATVHVRNRDATQNLFLFDHETDRLLATTARVWDRIWLRGSIAGTLTGSVVANASSTTAPGTVYLDPQLARRGPVDRLGRRVMYAPVARTLPHATPAACGGCEQGDHPCAC